MVSGELLAKAKLSLEVEFPNGMFEWPAIRAKWEQLRQRSAAHGSSL